VKNQLIFIKNVSTAKLV